MCYFKAYILYTRGPEDVGVSILNFNDVFTIPQTPSSISEEIILF